jgi:ectoine hydroxylase-related dioxygenase (phytanoyl-CoA dioxygenase family)
VSWLERLDRDGFALIEHVLPAERVATLLHALSSAEGEGVRRREGVYAIRNLLDVPEVAALAGSRPIRDLVEPVLGEDAFAVRGILFDKTPDANWKVAWHQDLTIAVRARHPMDGFGPWSEKAGVTSVQPPATVLERMLTVRVHLDACGPDNGPVQVLPGSHRAGRLAPDQIDVWRAEAAPVATCLDAGGVLLMRPLLLHASSPARSPAHRRVIHLDFAADPLPPPLEWHTTSTSIER